MWPFRRKDAAPVMEKKAASILLSPLGYTSVLANPQASYLTQATEGYAINYAVHSCVDRIATSVASVEPKLYKRRKSGKDEEIKSHALLDLLYRPNAMQSRNDFMIALNSYFLISGNAYIYGTGMDARSKVPPKELQLFNPGKVKVEPGERGFLPKRYEYRPDGKAATQYDVDQITGRSAILHRKAFNPLDPWYGLSPLLAAAFGVDILNAGQKWNKKLLDNDARPSGALRVVGAEGKPAELNDDQYQRLRQMIDGMFSGADNAGRPLLLEGGLEWTQLSMTAKDADFLEGKHSAARDIALAYGVPPMLLGIPGDNTYSNMQEAKTGFWEDTVLPNLRLTLEALNHWLVPLYGEDLYLGYDEEMIPALESKRKAKADRVNASSYMTLDEKRAAMGMEAYKPSDTPGGTILVPSSNVPLDMLGDPGLAEPGSEDDEDPEDDA